MHRVTAALMFGLFACTGSSASKHAPTAPLVVPEPAPPPTIAHRVLALEDAALPGAEDVTATLDAFLDAAVTRIRGATLDGTERERAIATLSLIGQELDAQHFVYPARGLVDTLHDGLADLLIDADALGRLAVFPENQSSEGRQRLLRDAVRAPSTVFHVADCDVLSLLYVAVGDRLGLPISMIDIPEWGESIEHNYVVWTLSDGTLVPWEATSGVERTVLDDDHYAPDGPMSRASHVARRASGVPMTDDEVLGYYHRAVGTTLRIRGFHRRAVVAYRESIRLLPSSPVAPWLLAWLLLASPDPHVRDPAEAIAVAEKLAADWPEQADHVSLVAAAYASAGRWDDARTTQCQAIAMIRGIAHDGTCDAITIDPDDPNLGGWEQPLAMYLRCQAYVESRHAEWLAEAWRDFLGWALWEDLAFGAPPIPYVPPVDACRSAGDEPPR